MAGGALETLVPPEALRTAREAGWRAGPGRLPEVVVTPPDPGDVPGVLEWARREGLGVLPVGTGALASPVRDDRAWVALTSAAWGGVEEYEPADLTLTAGTGTAFVEIDGALRENDQWGPFDPPGVESRSLGGLVATAGVGPLQAGYGALRNHVLGATVVTGDGRVLRLGGRVVKNVAGYDLLRPVVGSRGRLGVITSVCVRAFPVPAVDRVLCLRAPGAHELLGVALQVATAPVLPASMVLGSPLVTVDGQAALVVRLHGPRATVDADQRTIEQHVGRSFEVLDARGEGAALVRELGDLATGAGREVVASVLPSALGGVLAWGGDADAALAVDLYSGLTRAGGGHLTRKAIDELRALVEREDGALRVRAWDETEVPSGTAPTPHEARLVERLTAIFDPTGLFWPART